MIALERATDERLHVTWEERALLDYVCDDRAPSSSFQRPYMHPIHSLAGDLITDCCPVDHPWHKGVSMTFSVIDDQNFWGGPTYREGRYSQLENVGTTRHDGWDRLDAQGTQAFIRQRLAWISTQGETWLSEHRALDITVRQGVGWWMRWEMRFTNLCGRALHFGSPATEGRAGAGYTGLFWRGSRAFQAGEAYLSDGRSGTADDMNGTRARWLALKTGHPENARQTTLIFADSSTPQPNGVRWFARGREYSGVAFAFAFDSVVTLQPAEQLALTHTIAIMNDALDSAAIERWAASAGV